MAEAARFSCEGCGKTYGWKAELAGRKVKCKCGQVMVVPVEPPAAEEDRIFDLAPEGPQVEVPLPKRPRPVPQASGGGSIAGATAVGLTAVPAAARAGAKRPAGVARPPGAGRPLAYQRGPTQRDRERTSTANTTDMTRDVHVPTALLVVGFLIYLAYYVIRANASGGTLAIISVGLGGMMILKALLMLGFAFIIAGPMGVSFGGIWTATLKLAAIAIFSDGVLTWVDYGVDKLTGMRGMFGGMVTFPILLGLYWVLFIYLFSLDPGDSWMIVILLCVFSFILRLVLIMVVLATVLNFGSGAAAGIGGIGTAAPASVAEEDAAYAEELDALKTAGLLLEAREYIAGGRQGALQGATEAFYAAGAKNVWFEVSKDINGKATPDTYIVELPADPAQRAKCFAAAKTAFEALGDTPDADDLKDTGSNYFSIGVP